MTLYLDTSAVVKLYASEPGSVEIRREVASASPIVSSLLTYVETRSALARKYRSREIDALMLGTGKADFEADWRVFTKIASDAAIVRRAGDLAEQLRLRAYDSIHLATAERLSRDIRSQVGFACFDAALNQAASMLGFIIVVS